MLKRIPLTICIVLATAALVVGCTPAQPEPTPAPSESATAEPTAEPTTEPTSESATMEEQLDALREEVAASSAGCDSWVESVLSALNHSLGAAGAHYAEAEQMNAQLFVR